MEKALEAARKLIPRRLFKLAQPAYHWGWAMLGKVWYEPSYRNLKIIGVTGTKGKTSVSELVFAGLIGAGKRAGLANGLRFVRDGISLGRSAGSMPGRATLPRFLAQAAKDGCEFAVVEMTSEGAAQFRHLPIPLDVCVVTNFAPEHIESHGSLEAYREAKFRIVRQLKRGRTLVLDGDCAMLEPFAAEGAKIGARVISLKLEGSGATWNDEGATVPLGGATAKTILPGAFGAKNVLLAAEACRALGVAEAGIAAGITALEKIPGRAERVVAGQPFLVVVDYAHTPDSLAALLDAYEGHRRICVTGSAGGGRDKWKRPEIGRVAAEKAEIVIVTDEDPFDDDPAQIAAEVASGANGKAEIILDRRAAIVRALSLAKPGDAVILAGKGAEQGTPRKGKVEPWDEVTVAREELAKLGFKD
jgi:UDP-N-acetylmuramoyl-L-alanyl-D-glutamate--2,6-diaminopimelate ligase